MDKQGRRKTKSETRRRGRRSSGATTKLNHSDATVDAVHGADSDFYESTTLVHDEHQIENSFGRLKISAPSTPVSGGWGWSTPEEESMISYIEGILTSIRHKKTTMELSPVAKPIAASLISSLCQWEEIFEEHETKLKKFPGGAKSIQDLIVFDESNSKLSQIWDLFEWRASASVFIADTLQLPGEKMICNDLMSQFEENLFCRLGMSRIPATALSSEPLSRTAVIFIPEYRPDIVQGIIAANWNPWHLSYVHIITHSLTEASQVQQECGNYLYYLNKILPFMLETKIQCATTASATTTTSTIPTTASFFDRANLMLRYCFEQMSIHSFPIAYLHQLEPEFWA